MSYLGIDVGFDDELKPSTLGNAKMPSEIWLERDCYGHFSVHRTNPVPSGMYKVHSTVKKYVIKESKP